MAGPITLVEKLRQIISAACAPIWTVRRPPASGGRSLVDYLNSTPLSARPGFGEVNGLGEQQAQHLPVDAGLLRQRLACLGRATKQPVRVLEGRAEPAVQAVA